MGDKFGWCKGIYEFSTDEAPEDGFNFLLFADEHASPTTTGRTGYAIEASRELDPFARTDSYEYGNYYYTHFSTAEVDTANDNTTTLKITTYQNKHSLKQPYAVETTDVLDTYTITKTSSSN